MSNLPRKNRWLSLALACALALCPLSALAADGADTVLPYQEKILSLPDGVERLVSMAAAPDGAIVAAGKGADGDWALLIWRALDGAPEVVPLSLEADAEISSIDVAPDGQVMVVLSNTQQMMSAITTDEQQTTAAQQQDGMGTAAQNSQALSSFFGGRNITTTVIWFTLDGEASATLELSGLNMQHKALSGRRIAVSSSDGGVVIYDETGAETQSLPEYSANAFAATDGSLFILSDEQINEVDLATGASLRSVPFSAGYSAKVGVSPAGSLFILTTEGGFILDPGAETARKAINLTGTLLGDPTSSVTAVGLGADGTIVALIGGGGVSTTYGTTRVSSFFFGSGDAESTLVCYTPLDPALTASRVPFTITALTSSTRLLKAVSDFQRAHPELEVSLQVQMEDATDAAVEDHIRTLNTDLLAGKGGDVLILDGLPVDQYISRGILKDLTALLPELDLLPNIETGSRYADGKTYAVPAQYSFYALWGNSSLIDGVTSLADLLDAAGADKSPLSARTPEEWLRLLYPASEAAFRDEQGKLHFDTPAFEAFLSALYDLYQAQGELAALDGILRQAAQARGGAMNIQEMLAVYNGVVAFYPTQIASLMQLSTAYSLAGGADSRAIALPSLDGEGRSYTPSCLAGINARSGQTALAEEFLRVLFSLDVQDVDQSSGLPATRAALGKTFDDAIERSEDGAVSMRMSIQGGVSMEMSQPDAAAWEALRALCESVDTPATVDETLIAFMVEETADFFEGRGTAQQAAYALHQRAWFYLNE